MIRVGLVDDHQLVRAGLASLLALAPDVVVAGEAEDGMSAVGLVETQQPDVLLLDARMPAGDGLWVLGELGRRGLKVACLVLTTFDDDRMALEAIRLGARGYLLKNVTLDRLLEAVRALAAGQTWLQPALTEAARRNLSTATPAAATAEDPEGPTELSAREREVLRLLAGGYSNREIAGALSVAEGTIKNHVSSILGKLGVRDRTRAVLRAADRGFL